MPTTPLAIAGLGAVLLILGLILGIHILWVAGIVLLVIGAALYLYAALIAPNRGRNTRL